MSRLFSLFQSRSRSVEFHPAAEDMAIGHPVDAPRGRQTSPRRRIGFRDVLIPALSAGLLAACNPATAVPPPATATPSPFQPSPLALITSRPSAAASSTLTPTPEPTSEQIAVVEYHHTTYRFSDEILMTTAWFEAQMEWLAGNGYHTLTADQLAGFLGGGEVPEKSVVLTFDIGTAQRADYTDNIIPALRRNRLHALFFVVTNAIADACGNDNKLCWEDLHGWAAEGLISVESHGVSHPDFTTISSEEQRWDMLTSRQVIAEKTGREPIGFAYPYDSYNDGATRVAESVGYQFAFAGNTRDDRAVHRSDPHRYDLPRVYPYSNAQIYPWMYAAYGKTFGELIAEYCRTPSSAATTPAGTPTASAATPRPAADIGEFVSACVKLDQIADSTQRLYALNHLTIPVDVSADTLAKISSPIIPRPSCNFMRGNHPRGIVLHATRGTLQATLNQFQQPLATSAHYVIDRDGQIYQAVPESLGAYHASCGGSRSVCLPTCPLCEGTGGGFLEPYLQTIGIELVNDGQLPHPETYPDLVYEDYLMAFGYRYWEDFPPAQLQSLVLLVNDIRARYGIPLELVVGHYRINSKTDPGPALNISWYRAGNPAREPIFSE
jgi:peptidoglycan/xylan/chitin deacetylase (PgdA/CDA1 family)